MIKAKQILHFDNMASDVLLFTLICFIDLIKAFDSLDGSILVDELASFQTCSILRVAAPFPVDV